MATYTTHYNLKKPATSDKIRIADFNGNADTIDSTMYDNASLISKLKADVGIVENTNTATHNISAGQYVIWKGDLYTASSAISSGATLSNANLTAVSGGGLNALNSNISSKLTVTSVADITSTNIDDNLSTGIYHAYFGSTVAGIGGSWGILIVIAANPVVCEQIVITQSGIAKRHKENGTWTAWKKTTLS